MNKPLIFAIKGDHCGKYARRIHHRNEDIIILAIITRVDGAVDVLTDETLELDPGSLCICAETKDKDKHLKKLNDELMQPLRAAARKTFKK